MLGKTHLAVGTAVAFAFIRPDTLPELCVGFGAAAIGGVISDIDVGTSESSKDANKIIGITLAVIVIISVLEYMGKIGISAIIKNDSNLLRIVTGMLGFLGVCWFGKTQPHRSFMHSFLALVILSGLLSLVVPVAVPYFMTAFMSHLITDLFNYKKVMLLYPMRRGICLKMFHAHGTANNVLFLAGVIGTAADMIVIGGWK